VLISLSEGGIKMVKHKCVKCGFLAARNSETRQLDEVERNDEGGIDFVYVQYGTGNYREGIPLYDNPICFARAATLLSEYTSQTMETGPENTEQNRIKRVLERERDCKSFIKWEQGRTPKEHQDMLNEQRKLEYQERREKEDKEWRSAQHKPDRIFTVVAGAVGAVVGALLVHFLGR
jgi:hypothetical protein